MKKTPIGHVCCPVCDHADAEVKTDKNDHAYIHCTDCNAQTFTRNEHRNTKLRARMRPVTVTVTEPAAVPVTAPVPPPAPATKADPLPAAVLETKPPAKKTSWFQPIMGSTP